nr:FIVAR domain-containing protein [Enterococcus innesii]
MNKKQLKVKMIGITLFSAIFLGGSIYGLTQMNSDQARNQSTAESSNGFKPMERSQDSQSAIDSVKKAQSNTEQNNKNPIDQTKENNKSLAVQDFSLFKSSSNPVENTVQKDLLIFDTLATKADKENIVTVSNKPKEENTAIDQPDSNELPDDSNVLPDPKPIDPIIPEQPVIPEVPVDPEIPVIPIIPIVVDYSELESVVENSANIDKSLFVSSSVYAFTREYSIAEQMIQERTASQTQVNQQVQALKTAIENLVKKGNTSSLSELISRLSDIDREIYTVDSLNVFDQAFNEAKQIISENDSSQSSIDASYTKLESAYDQLRKVEQPDLSLIYLARLVKECEALSADDYTPDSYDVLSEKLSVAKGLLQQESVQENDVNSAYQELVEAKNSLVNKADKSQLISIIYSAEQLIEENYTAESWEVFISSLTQAQAISSDENATQNAVDSAVSALEGAMNDLVNNQVEIPEEESEEFDQAATDESDTEVEVLPEVTTPEEPESDSQGNINNSEDLSSQELVPAPEEIINVNESTVSDNDFKEPLADMTEDSVSDDPDASNA